MYFIGLTPLIFIRLKFLPLKIWKSKPDISDRIKTISYAKIPIRAVSELLKLCKHVKSDLMDVNVPALIIYAQNDHVIEKRGPLEIYDLINSQNKRILSLQQSYHIITLDVERENVFCEISSFINQVV